MCFWMLKSHTFTFMAIGTHFGAENFGADNFVGADNFGADNFGADNF
jgi:hypothetical protein